MRRSRIAWTLVLVAVGSAGGSAGASAEKLDKSACNVLNAELAGLVATGTRDDMQRGPAWAKTNLPHENLRNIMRLIELEEQLEFRCGMPRSRVAATAPAKVDKVGVPEEPERKPERKSSATRSIPDQAGGAKPLADVVKTVSRAPVAATPSAQQATVDSGEPLKTPSVAAQPAGAAAKPVAQKATPPKTTAATGLAGAVKPDATAATAPAPAKSTRRQSSAGYVSPSEVNPFFVTRYGDTP
jgi:hypothetical protein